MSSVAPSLPTTARTPKRIVHPASWTSWPFRHLFEPYTTKLNSPNPGPRARPALWDISDGCILWLPKSYAPPLSQDSPLRDPPPGALHHPILVLDVAVSGPEDAVISFATMRSFKASANGPDTSRPYFLSRYMQISPSPSVEPNAIATSSSADPAPLYLERYRPAKSNMTAAPYVDTGAVYSARWEDLRCYAKGLKPDGARFRLSEESYARVRERMEICTGLGMERQAWVPTTVLWEVFATRFVGAIGELGAESGRDG